VFAASASTFWNGPVEVDYMGVVNTIEAAKAANVSKIVLVSSRLVNPSNRFHPIRMILNNIKCGLMDNKFKGEEALRQASLSSPFSYTIVRPGGLVGGEALDGKEAVPKAGKRVPNTEFVVAGPAEGNLGTARDILRADVATVVVEALFAAGEEAKNKTVEIVARAAVEGEIVGHDAITGMFKALDLGA
jgi:nucleoside-diphosphate-sugar epimerase